MAALLILTQAILVRVQAPQPKFNEPLSVYLLTFLKNAHVLLIPQAAH